MNSNELLSVAIVFATEAHLGQCSKDGSPYILHPLRVAEGLETITEKIVALLHDTVEDTDTTIEQIEEIFGESIAISVNYLTKRKGQKYSTYIEGIKADTKALNVKLKDLLHNMDLGRLPEITDYDIKRQDKYEEAYLILTNYKRRGRHLRREYLHE